MSGQFEMANTGTETDLSEMTEPSSYQGDEKYESLTGGDGGGYGVIDDADEDGPSGLSRGAGVKTPLINRITDNIAGRMGWRKYVLGATPEDVGNQLLGIATASTFLGGIGLQLTTDPVVAKAWVLQVAVVLTVVCELVSAVASIFLRLLLFSESCKQYERMTRSGRYLHVMLFVFSLFALGVLSFFVALGYITFNRFSAGVGVFAVVMVSILFCLLCSIMIK